MTEKNRAYFFERYYKMNVDNKDSVKKKRMDFATAIMGKDFAEKLSIHVAEVSSYLSGKEFENKHLDTDGIGKAVIFHHCRESNIEKTKEYLSKDAAVNFDQFYVGYMAEGLEFLQGKIQNPQICNEGIADGYLTALLNKLQKVCLHILIYELQVCKKDGLLQGKDAKEEYNYFMDEIVNDSWIRRLEQKYPIMLRSVEEVIESSALLYADAVNRLDKDKAEIQEKLCGNHRFTVIEKIEGDIADSHCGGKSVLRMHLDNGCRIIYKPHSIENERVFKEFVFRVGMMADIKMYRLSMVERKGYGWVECVENYPCINENQLHNYYKRMGIYLFVFYLLGTNDIHNENIIACGEYPVVIDLENIAGAPSDREGIDIAGKVQLFLKNSVLHSGALPSFKWSKKGANINISGVGGSGRNELPFKMPKVINGRTSDIKMIFYHPSFDEQANVPIFNGKKVNPAGYLADIVEGFRTAYDCAAGSKGRVKLWLKEFENLKSRYLLADTQRYAMCLNSSYNPLLMDDGAKRQLYLYTMWYGRDMDCAADKEIVESEIRDLLGHDIPYFYFKLSGRGIFDSRGKEIKEYFNRTPVESLLEKAGALNESDKEHQSALIEMTIKLQEQSENNLINANIPMGATRKYERTILKNQLIHIAEKLGDYIAKKAVRFDGGDIGWYTANVAARQEFSWNIQPIDMYLYGGVMGINLFFHRLDCYTHHSKYSGITKVLDRQLFSYTDSLLEKKPLRLSTGLYNGETSIMAGYLYIYRITGQRSYLEYARRHADIVTNLLKEEGNYDLLDGLAGAITGLSDVDSGAGGNYLKAAIYAGDKLLDCAIKTSRGICWKNQQDTIPLLGISHGTAGIMMAFAKLYEATGREQYYDAMAGALAYEDANYDDELGNWIDFRANADDRKEADTVAWCHGAGGILMSRLAILDVVKDELKDTVNRDIERAAKKLEAKWLREGLCFCHGSCGNLLMLKKYADVMNDRELKGRIREYAGRLAALVERGEWLLQERYNPGLMNGYTGVGISMLELSDYSRNSRKNHH